ncbi:hypothetical protein CVT26_014467 [Gymnopilus dilepis]|uniref:Uncharacterized protein n=1 Tax=Gymnopilus dilepis TaxID=231916 RepID=A0A409VVF1_9AGAR|nr:hypothetical protein CVT26_014467 [Gymnopilus dilepis]
MVDGILLHQLTDLHYRKVKAFAGTSYDIVPVTVYVERARTRVKVEANVFVWKGDIELADTPWNLEDFVRDKLSTWLNIFSGAELVG